MEINPNTTVREIIKTHPQCREVFEKYGMGNCNSGHGPEGPDKPIQYFSERHGVALEQLIVELNQVKGN